MLWLDLETYCTTPIKAGVYRYAEDAEILMIGYAIDNAPARVIDLTATGGVIPADLLGLLRDPDVILCAHNSNFDRTVLSSVVPEVKSPARWRDSMICAFSLSLPGALFDLCQLCRLPVDKAKDADGKRLVRLFCSPRADGSRITGADRPDDWARFVNYCRLDVESMRAVVHALPRDLLPSPSVWAEWHIDQRINDRGMCIDRALVSAAASAAASAKLDADQLVCRLTGGEARSVGEIEKMIKYALTSFGYTLPDMQRSTLENRLNDPALPDAVRGLISARLSASKASVKKYDALALCTSSDGRLRGCLQFMGAVRTGRWTGKLFQPQNLPRGSMSPAEVDEGITALKSGIALYLYDDVMTLVSNCLRGAICAPKGRKLVVADLSNIEGRVLAWLAGESWKLDAFREFDAGKGPDLYKVAYSRAFAVSPSDVNKKQRQIGKVMELAMGYQGGVGAFANFAGLYHVDLDDMAFHVRGSCDPNLWGAGKIDHARRVDMGLSIDAWEACDVIKTLWRRAHPAICKFWRDIDNAVRLVLSGAVPSARAGRVTFKKSFGYLVALLPSGRPICYPCARMTGGVFEYYGQIQASRRWDWIRSYSGKICENLTQATARDVLASCLSSVESNGYKIVLSVHDELITECPDAPDYTAAGLAGLMATHPAWAPDLPLSAAGFDAYRYRKD
jgi:DNA polymerase